VLPWTAGGTAGPATSTRQTPPSSPRRLTTGERVSPVPSKAGCCATLSAATSTTGPRRSSHG